MDPNILPVTVGALLAVALGIPASWILLAALHQRDLKKRGDHEQ